MATKFLSRIARPAFGVLLAVVLMAAAMPGGFALRVERPGAAHGDAVALVRADGCHQPSKAKVSGTAEGLVRGERRSVPLKLKAVAAGVYTVERQWPAEGAWVLAVTGTYRGLVSSVLIEVGPGGKATFKKDGEALRVRTLPRALTNADVEYALQKLTANEAPASESVGS